MNWKELLRYEIESAYKVTEGLIGLVSDDDLGWKPSTGNNWMTTGQLLEHISSACGLCFRGFVARDWSFLEGMSSDDSTSGGMPPPAEKLPAVSSVREAREKLEKDKRLALEMLAECDEARLSGEAVSAPWDTNERILGLYLLEMVAHMIQHKGQLFYYLKLQGKAVDSRHLWGM